MDRKESKSGGRVFTVELNSRSSMRELSAPRGSQRVVIEGTIGTLRRAEFVDDAVLELTGSGGVLQVDLSREDLAQGARKKGDGAK